MIPQISIGTQSFEKLRMTKCFYVDKTNFIKEWWERNDDVDYSSASFWQDLEP